MSIDTIPMFDIDGEPTAAVAPLVAPDGPSVSGLVLPALVLPDPALTIVVRGVPGPQGSKTHKGNGVMVESSALVKPWRQAVTWQAVAAKNRKRGFRLLEGALLVEMVFTLARPRGHFGTGRNAGMLRPSAPLRPGVKPDLSKLIRSTEDALSQVVYRDDALIVEYVRLGKWYASAHGAVPGVLDSPGCTIRLWELPSGGEA